MLQIGGGSLAFGDDRPVGSGIVATVDVELVQDAVDVILDCAHFDEKAVGDLLVGKVLAEQLEHLFFTGGQIGAFRDTSSFIK